ncbi:cell death abnormality protein 1-like [Bacillus rossius redtenbacheri]|uniref:cell death abnormality protein 1-like n=1 Tax=Bacillus rossius redtenbacheri TaxID=93214 RepID=UPI002FDD793D
MRAATLLALLALWAASGAEQCPPYDVLEKIVYLPHPRDCSLFRRCQAGEPVLGHCPAGQHFAPGTSACGDPAGAGCEARDPCSAGEPRATCRYLCSCSKEEGNTTCPAKLEFSPQMELFRQPSGPSCPEQAGALQLGGLGVGRLLTANVTGNASSCPGNSEASVAHFADCSKMVVCGADGSEQAHACPAGQLYSPDLGLCDAPEFVTCGSPPPAGGGCPLAGCRHACRCAVTSGACPAAVLFSAAVRVTDTRAPPACPPEPAAVALGGGLVAALTPLPNTTRASRCPAGAAGRVYLPDPEDCGRVTLCSGDSERTVSCPTGLHFNLRTRSCGRPDPAVCGGPRPSTPPPPAAPAAPAEEEAARDDVPCPTTWACPAGRNSSVPHLSDCTMFCRCGDGGPFLGACPPGLQFGARAQACQPPAQAGCRSTCPQISVNERGRWEPEDCTSQDGQEGARCHLACNSGYQLIGSEAINCTSRGWYGSGGLNHIPSCNTPDELAEAVDKKLNETLDRLSEDRAGIMFLLDESLSVDPEFFVNGKSENFQAQKNLVDHLVKGFPLSENRSAGVITFSTDAEVDIGLQQTSTCDFASQLGRVSFFGGNTDLAAALQLAAAEINATSPPRKTLVLIVTDGQSQTDPAPAAAGLRAAGHVVFSIAVADFDRRQLEPISSTHTDGSKLFFAMSDFKLFRHVEYYLRAKYQNTSQQCP